MSAEAIRTVTLAIQSRLRTALVTAGTNQLAFVGPLDDQAAGDAALILFLYRVAINQAMRNSEHTVLPTQQGNPQQVYTHSLPLDLHSLLTVASTEIRPARLNRCGFWDMQMQALNDSPDLVGSQVDGETIRLSLDAATNEEMSRVWALFPTVNYRTSVLYLASPVWVDPATPQLRASGVINQDILASQVG